MTGTTVTAARLLTAEDLAERFQFFKDGEPNPAPIYRLTREKKLKAVKLGRYYRYRIEDIELFEAGGGTDSNPKGST
jgi:hypothetical protein